MSHPIPSTLGQAERDTTAAALQASLVDLVDLSLVAKQAHWNLVGRQFHDVHLHLDELVATARDYSDKVAERMSAIGVPPDGRARTVTRARSYPTSPRAGSPTGTSSTNLRGGRRRGAQDAAAHRRDREDRPGLPGPADLAGRGARGGALDVAGAERRLPARVDARLTVTRDAARPGRCGPAVSRDPDGSTTIRPAGARGHTRRSWNRRRSRRGVLAARASVDRRELGDHCRRGGRRRAGTLGWPASCPSGTSTTGGRSRRQLRHRR